MFFDWAGTTTVARPIILSHSRARAPRGPRPQPGPGPAKQPGVPSPAWAENGPINRCRWIRSDGCSWFSGEQKRRPAPLSWNPISFAPPSSLSSPRSFFLAQRAPSGEPRASKAEQWSSEPRRRRRPPRRRARSPAGERAAVERPGCGTRVACSGEQHPRSSVFFSLAGEMIRSVYGEVSFHSFSFLFP